MNTKNIIIICIALFLAGIIFWPTLYRYDKITISGNSFPVRINRLTGYTEYFTLNKWVPAEGQQKKIKGIKVPIEILSEITGNASISYGAFSGKIYNGSNWTITNITFRVQVKEKDGNIRWNRKFNESIQITPLSTSSFSISVTGDQGIDTFDWDVVEALGFMD